MRLLVAGTIVSVLLACPKPEAPLKRVALNRTGGSTFELLTNEVAPALPYCLVYTVSEHHVTRQLTMSKNNTSFDCQPGKPIGKHPYRVPVAEGPVKLMVLFTSQPVNAGSISQQLLEAPDMRGLSAMNLRLPGSAVMETLEFAPEEDVAPLEGRVLEEPDAGTAAPDPGDAGP